MPANMRKAGMKYQKGGSKKKSETLGQASKRIAKKVDDTLEKATSGAINKIPAYKKAKGYVKNLMGMQSGGSMKKKYGMGGPKASNYVGNPMGYFNDKAMYGKEQMMKAQDGKLMDDVTDGARSAQRATGAIQDLRQQKLDAKLKRKQTRAKIRDARTSGGVRGKVMSKMQSGGTVSKPKSKRRTVTVSTKNPRPGTVGGSPVTTKTITKKRGDKTITKTKSVRNPIGPFKSTVSKSKTVTKAGPKGPFGRSQQMPVKSKGSNKQVSQKRGRKMQSRMKKKG